MDARRESERARVEAGQWTERRNNLRKLEEAVDNVGGQLLKDVIDPLMIGVRGYMGEEVGAFTVLLDGGGCKVGLLREQPDGTEVLVPLRALAGGEILLVLHALVVTACDLRNPMLRLVLLDNLQDLDPSLQGGLVMALASLVEEGKLDQLVAANHYCPVGLDGETITVIKVPGAYKPLAGKE
jgi:hypothetical protein